MNTSKSQSILTRIFIPRARWTERIQNCKPEFQCHRGHVSLGKFFLHSGLQFLHQQHEHTGPASSQLHVLRSEYPGELSFPVLRPEPSHGGPACVTCCCPIAARASAVCPGSDTGVQEPGCCIQKGGRSEGWNRPLRLKAAGRGRQTKAGQTEAPRTPGGGEVSPLPLRVFSWA